MTTENEKPQEEESVDAGAPLPESDPERSAPAEPSMDDLLEDVRRSLIEADAQNDEKKPGWLSRITKGFQKDQPAGGPVVDEGPLVVEEPAQPAPEADAYLDEIDNLIEMLEPATPATSVAIEPISAPEPAPEPEPVVDLEELKKRVFSPPATPEPEEISEVRAVALDGGEEVFVEVEARREDPGQERMKAFENSLRPFRQYIYFAVAFLGVVLAVLAAGIMYTAYQRTRPPEPTPIPSNLPYPVALSLPGGLNFNLGKGALKEGRWNPTGPEWLQGTEVCRWVAIPWSRQLEAVVRTLTRDDSLELAMSNNDRLSYDVFSIQQLTLEEMQALDQNSPCLLLVLAEQDAEKRWVVTARP